MPAPSPYAALVGRTPVRAAEVAVGGVPTRTWTYGPDGAAHRIVALHGLRGDHHGLAPLVAHLPGCRVTVPDLPGFGASPPLPGRHDVAGYAAWAGALVAAVAPGAVLLGHSFGSLVAAAAVAGGLPVAALVLVNPIAGPALGGPRVLAAAATAAYHRLAAALPQRAGTALLRSRAATRLASAALVTTPDPALRRWIHTEHDRRFRGFADRRVVLEAFAASVARDLTADAARLRVRALLVAGERDDIAPLPAQRLLADLLPDGRLVTLPGVGHLAHYEAPAAVAAAVRAFLDAP